MKFEAKCQHSILMRVKNGIVFCAMCHEILGHVPNKEYFKMCGHAEMMQFFKKQALKIRGIIFKGCISCGCADERACIRGCSWVSPGKCSACFKENGDYIDRPFVKEDSYFKEMHE